MVRATPPARAVAILDALERHHPDADTELVYRTPFELLVATVLSAQSTDRARERGHAGAVRALSRPRPRSPRPRRPTSRRSSTPPGSSARRPSRSSACRRRWSPITAARCRPTWTRWSTLPGVGRKTANVVLGHALGVPGLPVDRHVLRVAGRLGLIHTDDAGEGRSAAHARCCRRSAGPGPPTRSSCTGGGSAGRRRSVRSATPDAVSVCDHRGGDRARPARRAKARAAGGASREAGAAAPQARRRTPPARRRS